MPFDHSHYVAAIRWKQAEKEALQCVRGADLNFGSFCAGTV
jgi:hypothetical protein